MLNKERDDFDLNIKISVIIPVYNAEKYIEDCIKSLLNQSLQECEFIFVNDGSEDNSSQVIEKYKKHDSRMKLINQENQGVSIARNEGLQVATGKYVGFVDADDFIESDMFKRLYQSAQLYNCDIVISNFESELEGHKVITKYPFPKGIILSEEYLKTELLPYFLKSDNFNTVCNKIFKNKLIKSQHIIFPEKVALGEDGMFNIQFFSYAETAMYIDYTGYHYREVPGSATRSIEEKDYFNRAIEVYTSKLPEIYLTNINQEKVQQFRSIKLIYSVLSYIHMYFTPSENVSFIKRYRYVKNMIHDKNVREALPLFTEQTYGTLGRYEKFLLFMIKNKVVMGLYCAFSYSRYRNKYYSRRLDV
ncbi:glycosyltransferase [Bacillus sp. JJ634]